MYINQRKQKRLAGFSFSSLNPVNIVHKLNPVDVAHSLIVAPIAYAQSQLKVDPLMSKLTTGHFEGGVSGFRDRVGSSVAAYYQTDPLASKLGIKQSDVTNVLIIAGSIVAIYFTVGLASGAFAGAGTTAGAADAASYSAAMDAGTASGFTATGAVAATPTLGAGIVTAATTSGEAALTADAGHAVTDALTPNKPAIAQPIVSASPAFDYTRLIVPTVGVLLLLFR